MAGGNFTRGFAAREFLAGFARDGIWQLRRRRSPALASHQLRRLFKARVVFSRPLFQNESSCKTIQMKMCSPGSPRRLHSYSSAISTSVKPQFVCCFYRDVYSRGANQTHYHMKCFARGLVLKQRHMVTRK